MVFSKGKQSWFPVKEDSLRSPNNERVYSTGAVWHGEKKQTLPHHYFDNTPGICRDKPYPKSKSRLFPSLIKSLFSLRLPVKKLAVVSMDRFIYSTDNLILEFE